MAEDNQNAPEEVTMRDLWRHISGMESRMNARFDGLRDELKGDIAEVKGETQAIRQVVDTLASQEDFGDLDRKIASVSADTQATRQAVQHVKSDVSRLREDVKRARIAVR